MKSKILLLGLFIVLSSVFSCTEEKLSAEEEAVTRLVEAASDVFAENSFESFLDQEFYENVSQSIDDEIEINELYPAEEIQVYDENALSLMLESSEEFATAYYNPIIQSITLEEVSGLVDMPTPTQMLELRQVQALQSFTVMTDCQRAIYVYMNSASQRVKSYYAMYIMTNCQDVFN